MTYNFKDLTAGLAVAGAVFAASFGTTSAVAADEAALEPALEVITVTYDDGSEKAEKVLTLGDLMALPRNGFETETVWTEGVQRFDGVWLTDLVNSLEISEGLLELSALNEYLVEFNVPEIPESKALVAYLHNGEPMSARSKGPLWVVFPYDEGPEFQTELTYMLSIWQLDRILVLP
ncbi:oxidoreductase [Thalassobius sp. MITS945101]|uniref:oxidoreductase n=1 Tax=Thalassobius sp. MITS945101 TaxID=3096994 RepID=UPI003999FC03